MTAIANDNMLPAQPSMRPPVDKQAGRKDAGGFGEALKTADGETRTKAEGRSPDEPRWHRFGRRLDTVIAAAEPRGVPDPKGSPVGAEVGGVTDMATADPEPPAKAETENDNATLPLVALHFPPVHIRRPAPAGDDAKNDGQAGDVADDASLSPNWAAAPDRASHAGAFDKEGSSLDDALRPHRAARDQLADRIAQATGDSEEGPAGPVRAATAGPTPRATVLSEQNFPTPLPSTCVLLAEKIVAETNALDVAGKTQTLASNAQSGAAPAHALKIQLHPTELGMVTASLRLAGGQLSIELQVENQEAYQRLSVDSEAIVASLRGLGYEIDKLTILQPAIAISGASRTDSEAAASNQAPRGGEAFGSDRGSGSGSRNTGGGGNGAHQNNGPTSIAARRDGAGVSLYI